MNANQMKPSNRAIRSEETEDVALGAVLDAVVKLERSTSFLSNKAEILEKKLEPVLCSNLAKGASSAGLESPARSVVVERLTSLLYKIESISSQLDSMIDRADI